MSKEDRREQILDAAAHVVARGGLAAASTDEIARQAGVSQPYVVRTFGGKQPLLDALFQRIADRIVAAFEDAPREGDAAECLGRAYLELVEDRDVLLVLMHGFTASSEPGTGAAVRGCMDAVYRIARERFGDDELAAVFVAQGMLINVMLAMDAWNHPDLPDLTALATTIASAAQLSAKGRGR
ncbi:TetR/AcrR family transcriptional regulator [Kineococcus radiotolerans]|uniref:Transcriptional regulator, TetR family n=1 Tax=Kineococcus radiotolerans (strain ATCC BAA-149 / DSM 14245 / SRS30216) TaxID=266940 RepID=A6W7Z7_KINRD|nr:TetR family transcriptional regulator [Kineococcus radiotolerans]ABS02936.1 transcriptional regulator, TetR family [Kineococcus radiotolerans SRS30216 = ATCC BAA-149]